MLRYDFALSHNAFLLNRIVIASNGYRPENIGPVIAFYSYRPDVIDQRFCVSSLSLFGKIAFTNKYNKILFCFTRKKPIQK
jgi:hypothetical protein